MGGQGQQHKRVLETAKLSIQILVSIPGLFHWYQDFLMLRSVLQHGLPLLHRLTTEEGEDERDSQRWRLPRGAWVWAENTDGDERLPTNKANCGSSWSPLSYHSPNNELFTLHTRQTPRDLCHLCLFTAPLGHFPALLPPPPKENAV